jgi:WD40 repeat protein
MQIPAKCVWLCVLALAGSGVFAASAQTAEHPRLMAQAASGEVIACAYSPDGRSVMTGGREGVARLWDTATGEELQFFPGASWVRQVAVSSDNRRVFAYSELDDKLLVQLWDAATGKELGRFSPPSDKLIFRAISPDGGTMATAISVDKDEQGKKLPAGGGVKVQIWDGSTGKELQHFIITGAFEISELAILSPDKSKLFTGDFDGPRLWDVRTGKLLRQFGKSGEVVSTAAFSVDGRMIVWGTIPGVARLWDLETGKELQHFAGDYSKDYMGAIDSVSISADGRRVLTGSNDGNARVWDVETGKDLQSFAASSEDNVNRTVNCVALSPDGQEMLTASDDRTARLWNVETGKEIHRLTGMTNAVAALAFVADGRGVVEVSRTGMVWRWDAQSGEAQLRPLQTSKDAALPAVATGGAGSSITTVALSPDGRRLLLAIFNGEQGVWDAETGKEIQSFDWHTIGSFLTADFSPDGRKMLTNDNGLSFSLWDVDTGKEVQHFTVDPGWRPRFLYPEGDPRSGVERLALSPDGHRALTSDMEGSFRLWNVDTGKQVRVFTVHSNGILDVGFSSDGSKMLTENADSSSTLRDVKRGSEIQHFGSSSRPSFSADSSRVLIGSSVWDAAAGKELRRFTASSGSGRFGSISADGRRVLLGGSDGVTWLWDVDTGNELAMLYGFMDGSWAVVDPEGRFDTDKIEGNVALHWVVDGNPMRVLPLAAYKDGYYTPGLLKRILGGEKLPAIQ